MITHSFFKAPHVKRDGKSKLYLRITIEREHKYFEIMNINSKLWSKAKGRLRPVDEDASKMNGYLNQMAREVDQVLFEIQSKKLAETFVTFESLYFKTSVNLISFYKATMAEMKEPEYNPNTVRIYKNCLEKLETFLKGKTIKIEDVDYDFIARFEKHMIKMGLKRNTIATQLKKLNKILNDARKQKIIDRNPFENFKIRQEKTHRVFLLKDELKKMQEYYDKENLNAVLKNTLQAFLFSCYTGFRHSDVVKIKYKDINGNNSVDITLKKKTSNGYKRLIVPLSKKAINLLDLDSDPDSLIFPNLITATKCSPHLKAIAGVCGIDKAISFHSARHTFATISLGIGIELKKVSELLGHDSIRTTEIYAHLVEEHLKSAVDKWDRF